MRIENNISGSLLLRTLCTLNIRLNTTILLFSDRFIGSDADPPDYVRFYLLNVTNVAEVRSGGKPILVRAKELIF